MEFTIDKKILKSVVEYCKTNGLDINIYLNKLIKQAHFSHVYGEQPIIVKPKKTEQPVIENTIQTDIPTEIPTQTEALIKPLHVVGMQGIQVVPIDKKPKVRKLN